MKKLKLINKAQDYYNITGVIPKSRYYKDHKISQTTVSRYFGNWTKFLNECGIPTYLEQIKENNIKKCNYCSKMFEKNKNKHIFCSQSCSAKFNNNGLKHGKYSNRYSSKVCPNCNKTHNRCLAKFCSDFCNLMNLNKMSTKKDKIKKNLRNQYTLIRMNARTVAKYLNFDQCSVCNYDKHIEVAHIKDIKDFDDTATLYEINHPDNLSALCPNCHWEFDNGLLEL